MLDVQISSPNSTVDPTYLPYGPALLKTYCERDPELSSRVRWREPLYQREPPSDLLDRLDPDSIDVLGLGCYIWNWYLQQEVGRTVKRANPDCLVVAGGPNCDASDPDFFRDNPFVDIVVRQEGEEPLRRILRKRLAGRSDWEDIPGLYVPDEDGRSVLTSEPELLDETDLCSESPFETQSDLMNRVIDRARSHDREVFTAFQTNRGCPYECSFCDWGSLTNTRVRKLEMDRVRADLRWIAEHEVDGVNIADANLGMFERDVDIISFLGELKRRWGSPRTMLWNPSKSEANHLRQIMKSSHEAGLSPRAMLSMQHTDPDVLDAMNRTNLSNAELQDLIRFNQREEIPMEVQLILGSPGDTYDRWKSCFEDLMEWGLDGEYFVSNYHVLPNAPAADPQFRERWEIDTTLTRNLTHVEPRRDTHVPEICQKELVTSTSSFDERDWIRMWLYSYVVQAFHTMNLTRYLALHLRYREDVPFRTFYESIAEEFCLDESTLLSRCYREMKEAKRTFLEEDRILDRRKHLAELPDYSYFFKWDEWLFIRCLLDDDRFYSELESFLLNRYELDEHRLADLVRFQKLSRVGPDYSPRRGVTFRGDYDWVEYFDRDRESLASPPRRESVEFFIDQRRIGHRQEPITWHRHAGDERLRTWVETVIRHPLRRLDEYTTHDVGRRAAGSVFQSVGTRLRDLMGSA